MKYILVGLVSFVCGGLVVFFIGHTAKKPIQTTSPQVSERVFKDEKHGYSIRLPKEIAGVTEQDGVFNFSTHDANWIKTGQTEPMLFRIDATPKSDIKNLTQKCSQDLRNEGTWFSGCFPLSAAIGSNNKYIFTFIRADKVTDFPSDFTEDMFLQAQRAADTIETFDVK